MSKPTGRVLILDDDDAVCRSLQRLLHAESIETQAFTRASDLYSELPVPGPCCVVLDLNLGPGEDGHAVFRNLRARGHDGPVVFLTAYGDVPNAVKAMQNGAAHFLLKPYQPEELLSVIRKALARAAREVTAVDERAARRALAAKLTPRERQVLSLAISGLVNKQIADRLGLALITVKIHRGRAMRRLGAHTAAELARFADVLDIATDLPSTPSKQKAAHRALRKANT